MGPMVTPVVVIVGNAVGQQADCRRTQHRTLRGDDCLRPTIGIVRCGTVGERGGKDHRHKKMEKSSFHTSSQTAPPPGYSSHLIESPSPGH